MLWQIHCTHLEENCLNFSQRDKISLFFLLWTEGAISRNKMSQSSATMWPSNNTWLWIHLLMGEKWVFYTTVISAGVDRAKTLNPLSNLLDQFSSTYTPLRKCRIITGYLHFILIFTHKKGEKKSLTREDGGPFVPSTDGPVMTHSATFTEAALSFRLNFSKRLNCVSAANLLPWRVKKLKEKK